MNFFIPNLLFFRFFRKTMPSFNKKMQDFCFNPAFLRPSKEVSPPLSASCILHFFHKSAISVRPVPLPSDIHPAAWQKTAAHFCAFSAG
ncbi:MAG TPA: hypothetical protein K8V82_05375 [Lachnoclostridium phocaeense]|uniref:Uncharacterized protein n=1 Tax=Lachnoclostridium phocaeense TaxID=1871021 RepID=A0A921I2F2_9FIRM|nr:hypothetical protein [Lachnoclostridium phocaeense]